MNKILENIRSLSKALYSYIVFYTLLMATGLYFVLNRTHLETNNIILVVIIVTVYISTLLVLLLLTYKQKQIATEAKKSKSEKQHFETNYSEIFNGAKDIIYIQDQEGKFLEVNKQAEETFGYNKQELIGKTPEFISAPEKNDLEYVKSLIKKTFDGEPQHYEFWGKNNKGKIFPKQVNLNKGKFMGKDVVIAFSQDISEQKNSESELKKLAAFANLNPYPVLRFNKRGLITYANTVSYIIFNENDILNRHVTDLLPFFKDINIKEYIAEDTIRNIEYKICGLDFLFIVQGVSELGVGHIYGNEITERIKAEQKMASAKIKAESLDKIKSEFLAQMSHEIRTPINTILSFSSLIKDEIEDNVDEELKSSFQGIANAGRRIIRTIDLLLNMSEIQTGSYELKKETLSLQEDVINNIIYEYKFIAEEKGLQLICELPEDGVQIFGDKYSVQQIFSNLVDNAVKYTYEGSVKIKLYQTITSVCLEIVDTGIGISEEYLPNLFTQFSQEDQGYTRKFEGNGLGLALIKHYCDFNQAAILVESKKGVGSKFLVKFPLQASENVFKIKDHI